MAGTLSPDGQWLWNGSEWIPAPPTSSPSTVSVDKETNVINEPSSETLESEAQQVAMQQPATKLELAPASASNKILNTKIIGGILISILLLGSIAFFLLVEESEVENPDIPDAPSGTWTSAGGEGIGIFGTDDDNVMYLVTYEPGDFQECTESPMDENWLNERVATASACYWKNRDYPNFQTFTVSSAPLGPRLCFDGNNAIEGAPGGCLTLIDDFVADHMLVIDDDGECEVLLGSTIAPPSDTFDADIVDDWYSDNKNTFDVVKNKYPSECKSTTGPSPINLLFEQIL